MNLRIKTCAVLFVVIFARMCFGDQTPPPSGHQDHQNNAALSLQQISFVSSSSNGSSNNNNVTIYQTSQAGTYDGVGDEIKAPQWKPPLPPSNQPTNNPICYIMNTTASVKLEINSAKNLNGAVEIQGVDSSDNSVFFDAKNQTINSGNNTIQIDASKQFDNKVSKLTKTFNWTIIDANGKSVAIGNSGPHTIYLVYGQPPASTDDLKPTVKRLDYVVPKANATKPGDIADNIGPDAVGGAGFAGGKSLAPNYGGIWTALDSPGYDCGTEATLMKTELNVIGVTTTVEVVFVWPRDANNPAGWKGLVTVTTPDGAHAETDAGGGILKYDNCQYQYEGCCRCSFSGYYKYWMGGEGKSEPTAYDVLIYNVTGGGGPNTQAYSDAAAVVVPYPNGNPGEPPP